jgi:Flp pilus assembly pilin Flp
VRGGEGLGGAAPRRPAELQTGKGVKVMLSLQSLSQWFFVPPREEGQGLVEYGLVISFVAMLIIGSLVSLRGQVIVAFSSIVSGLNAH